MNLFDLIGNLVISAYNALGGALKKGLPLLAPEKLMALNVKLVNLAANVAQGRRPPPRIVEDQPRKVVNRTSPKLDLDPRSAAAYRNRFPSDQAGAQIQHPSAEQLANALMRDGWDRLTSYQNNNNEKIYRLLNLKENKAKDLNLEGFKAELRKHGFKV